MSETQTFIAVLVLGLAVVLVVFALLRRRSGSAEFSVGEIFTVKVSLPEEEKAKAVAAVGVAAQEKGQSRSAATREARVALSSLERATVSRALWVDDNPDNNVNEVLALMHLAIFVVAATSNLAARRYLADSNFDLVITDLGRGTTKDDGQSLIDELHADQPGLPIIVYTSDASAVRNALVDSGATAVEDDPAALIAAVMQAIH